MSNPFQEHRKKRMKVGFAGCLFGLVVGAPVTYLLYGVWFNITTFCFCCAGTATALMLAERAKKILKAEDVDYLKIQNYRKPLNLSSPNNTGGAETKARADVRR